MNKLNQMVSLNTTASSDLVCTTSASGQSSEESPTVLPQVSEHLGKGESPGDSLKARTWRRSIRKDGQLQHRKFTSLQDFIETFAPLIWWAWETKRIELFHYSEFGLLKVGILTYRVVLSYCDMLPFLEMMSQLVD